MATTIKLPFESEEIAIPLPGGWQLVDTVHPMPHPKLEDERAGLIAALDHPTGTSPLRAKELAARRIVICVEDISRPTPTGRFFGVLLDYLVSHGAVPANMLILFGLGVHRDMSAAEVRHKLGETDLRGIPWRNHACNDERQLVNLGTTSRGTHVSLNRHLVEADLIITVGAIEPHLLLGFGGGCKMILPGLASAQTIAENHMQGVGPGSYNFVGITESPMRLDLEEGTGMLGKEIFIVNAVMNESLDICAFCAGHPIAAHREGVKLVRSLSARPVERQVDVALVSSHPMNADMRQGMKCIGNVEKSVKEGGLIIALLECRNGVGDVKLPERALPHTLLRLLLKIIGGRRVLWLADRARKNAGIEERFLAHFSLQVARRNQMLVYSRKLPSDTGRRTGMFVQFADVAQMMKAAKRYAPKDARVLAYPHGGATYPVMNGES